MSDSRIGASRELAKMKCVPCRGGAPPMKQPQINEWLSKLTSDWRVAGDHHLEREYRFPDFKTALDFVNRIGAIAESEGHHPDLELAWGRVGVTIFTHKIDGLTESDFILAAKIETL